MTIIAYLDWHKVKWAWLRVIPAPFLIRGALSAIERIPECPDDCSFLITAAPHGDDGHCTARIFSNEGCYLGGVHFFIDRTKTPDFEPASKAAKWKKRRYMVGNWARNTREIYLDFVRLACRSTSEIIEELPSSPSLITKTGTALLGVGASAAAISQELYVMVFYFPSSNLVQRGRGLKHGSRYRHFVVDYLPACLCGGSKSHVYPDFFQPWSSARRAKPPTSSHPRAVPVAQKRQKQKTFYAEAVLAESQLKDEKNENLKLKMEISQLKDEKNELKMEISRLNGLLASNLAPQSPATATVSPEATLIIPSQTTTNKQAVAVAKDDTVVLSSQSTFVFFKKPPHISDQHSLTTTATFSAEDVAEGSASHYGQLVIDTGFQTRAGLGHGFAGLNPYPQSRVTRLMTTRAAAMTDDEATTEGGAGGRGRRRNNTTLDSNFQWQPLPSLPPPAPVPAPRPPATPFAAPQPHFATRGGGGFYSPPRLCIRWRWAPAAGGGGVHRGGSADRGGGGVGGAPRPSACTMSAAIAGSAVCRRLEVLTRGWYPRGF
ncbi:hypothetical protein BJ912DRAFT_934832 [Pholiota molesta]|nr:hypothetical protein BJ912DRAFT_934832 [Pholiota molesta]